MCTVSTVESSESWCVLSRFQIGYPAPDLTLDYCNFTLTVAELSWFPPRKNVRTPISTPTRTFLRGATQLNSAQVREKCSIRNATRRILSHFRSKKCEKSKKISIRSQKSSQSWIADLKKQQNTPTFAGAAEWPLYGSKSKTQIKSNLQWSSF